MTSRPVIEIEYLQLNKYPYYTAHFKCPYCKSKYKKNGEPYSKASSLYHHHGVNINTDIGSILPKSPHCLKDYFPNGYSIHFDDNTPIKK